nr:acyl carrier protein [Micromonospora sp. DSM 115978]
MENVISAAAIETDLFLFVRDNCLRGEAAAGFSRDTPLVESGLLDSLGATKLLSHIREDLKIVMPTRMISAEHFRDVRSIAVMLAGLVTPVGGEDGVGDG